MRYAQIGLAAVAVVIALLLVILAGATLARADEDTALLQEQLNICGHQVPVTGNYGEMTEAAVRRFQEANDMEVDGIAGPGTRAQLNRCAASDHGKTIIIERPERRERPVEDYLRRDTPAADEYEPERDRRNGPQCVDQVVSVKGNVGLRIGGFAERNAITAWKTQVGDAYGNQYVEWENAADKKIDCDPACAKCTVRDECTAIGRPCRD